MMIFLITIHVIVCAGLITLVLIQRGRGGGLVDSFQGVESMFGTKTNAFLTRSTTVLSIVFFFTCLSLAILSVRQSKSLLTNVKVKPVAVTQASATPVQPAQAQKQAPVEAPKAQEQPTAQK